MLDASVIPLTVVKHCSYLLMTREDNSHMISFVCYGIYNVEIGVFIFVTVCFVSY